MSIYDYVVKDQQNNDVSLKEYEGKVLLIINSATGCGFTPQYTGLESLYEKYKDQGFEILDFPCNQFFSQAPGSDEQIHSFCTLKYNTQFKQFHKIKVNGKDAEPLFIYLESQNNQQKVKRIKWNFTKFLISKNGEVISRFEPTVKPEEIESSIVEQLAK